MQRFIFEVVGTVIGVLIIIGGIFAFNPFSTGTTVCYSNGTTPSFAYLKLSPAISTAKEQIQVQWKTQNSQDQVVIKELGQTYLYTGKIDITTPSITVTATNSSCEFTVIKRQFTLPIDPVIFSFVMLGIGISTYLLTFILQQTSKQSSQQNILREALLSTTVKRNIGVLIDFENNTPLSGIIIRFYRYPDHELVATVVTDNKGEFTLALEKGQYVCEVGNDRLEEIDSSFLKDTEDLSVTHLQPFFIGESSPSLSITIAVKKKGVTLARKIIDSRKMVTLIKNAVFAYFIVTLFVFVLFLLLETTLFILVIIFLNLLILGFLALRETSSFQGIARIVDKNGKPVGGIEVGLWDREFNVLLSQTYTKSTGEFILEWKEGELIQLQLLDMNYLFSNGQRVHQINKILSTNQNTKIVAGTYKITKIQETV